MKYIKVGWPEIQEYMDNPNYPEDCYFDPSKNAWFVPESWEDPWNKLTKEEQKEIFEELWYGTKSEDL